MTRNERSGRLASSGYARWAWRLLAAAYLALLLLSYPTVAVRLTAGNAAQTTVFQTAFGLTILASVCLIIRASHASTVLVAVSRGAPIRSLIFLTNLAISGMLVTYVAKAWGVILLMLLPGPVLVAWLFVSDRTRLATTDKLVRFSPVSFVLIYLCLGIGEAYLRFHPMAVGGGGGGNPALKGLYAGLYSFNSFGLRDGEFSEIPPRDVYRILALGDSFTFGQGVKLAETYVKQMETLLNARETDVRYQVIDVGSRGANTAGELVWLDKHGTKFHPDLITVQFYINDIGARRAETGTQHFYDVVTSLSQKSYVLFFLRYRLWSLGESSRGTDVLSDFAQVIADNGRGWRECSAALDGFGAWGRETGVPIVVILFPHTGLPHQATKIVHAAVTERSRRAGLYVIDLADAFLAVPPDDQQVSRIDHHPSALAHKIAADRIVESLHQLKLVPIQPAE